MHQQGREGKRERARASESERWRKRERERERGRESERERKRYLRTHEHTHIFTNLHTQSLSLSASSVGVQGWENRPAILRLILQGRTAGELAWRPARRADTCEARRGWITGAWKAAAEARHVAVMAHLRTCTHALKYTHPQSHALSLKHSIFQVQGASNHMKKLKRKFTVMFVMRCAHA